MIPVLLWRCPVCGTNDALRHRIRWRKPDRLWCAHCHIRWEVARCFAGDYRLRVSGGDAAWQGEEAPLAQWYDRMKAGVQLLPIQEPALALEPGEVLWLKSKRVKLLKEVPVALGAPGRYFVNKRLGRGQLFLTNERLIWKAPGTLQTFWLRKLRAVWAIVNRRLAIQYEDSEVFKFRFLDESLLKWLAYIGLVARRIEEVDGHRISLSHY